MRGLRSAFAGLLTMAVFGLGLAGGCRSEPVAAEANEEFSLSLYTSDSGLRITYFELDRNGLLSFAGGPQAPSRSARPLVTVSVQQRREIWNLIVKHRLQEATGSLFPHGQRVTYEFVLNTGPLRLSHTIGAADDQVPGLKDLHEHLLKLRATVPLTSPLPG